jgi:Gluconate 2-dehydrogenase subunit 3
MHRRELFRLLTAAALTPVLPPELFAFARQAQPAASYTIRTFSPHQNETVITLVDLILPATDTPGAKAARVNEWMDVILTDWATAEERDRFLKGVDGVDTQAVALFGKPFVELSADRQVAQLHIMDDAIDWRHDVVEHGQPVPRDDRDWYLRGYFFQIFKKMTIHGYFTSEIGFTQALKLQIIPGEQHGCAPYETKKA